MSKFEDSIDRCSFNYLFLFCTWYIRLMPYEIWQHWRVITMIPLPGLTSIRVRVRFGGVSLSLYPDCGQRRSYFILSKNKTAHERSKKSQGTPVAQWNETNCSSFISGCVVLAQLTPIILILDLVLDLLRCIRGLLRLFYTGECPGEREWPRGNSEIENHIPSRQN